MKDIQTKNIYIIIIYILKIEWISVEFWFSNPCLVSWKYQIGRIGTSTLVIFRYWGLRDSGQDKGNSLDILDNDKIKDEKMRR